MWIVHGKCLEKETGLPISGAAVAVNHTIAVAGYASTTKTNETGYYVFHGVWAGENIIAAGKLGYVPDVTTFTLEESNGTIEINFLLANSEAPSTDGILFSSWEVGDPCSHYIYSMLDYVSPYFSKWCGKSEMIICPYSDHGVDCRPRYPELNLISTTDFLKMLGNYNTKMLMIHCHGASEGFDDIYAGSAFVALGIRTPIPLVMSVSCNFMDAPNSPSSIAYQLRKGKTENTFVLGGYGKEATPSASKIIKEFLPIIDTNRDMPFGEAYNLAMAVFGNAEPVIWRGDGTLTLNKILSQEQTIKTILSIRITDLIGTVINAAYIGDTIYIIGTLTATETNEPLQNAEIYLIRNSIETTFKTVTNINGEYSIPYTVIESDYPSVTFKTRFKGA